MIPPNLQERQKYSFSLHLYLILSIRGIIFLVFWTAKNNIECWGKGESADGLVPVEVGSHSENHMQQKVLLIV